MGSKIYYPPLSTFGRFGANFSTKLNQNIKSPFIGLWPIFGSFSTKVKYKIPLYRLSADLQLICQQNGIQNIISPCIGFRPIWGLFLNKLNEKYKTPFYRPLADLRIIFK
jgi:hypothetical protein